MIRLFNGADEHPVWCDDKGDADVLSLVETKELHQLLVSILKALCVHVSLAQKENGMREQELVYEK